jgi:predicted DNA-binding transcriptional regulator YafY
VIYATISREQKIFLHYRDENGNVSARVIWPFTLGFFERVQLMVGWCELRRSFRSFRTDRVLSVSLLEEACPRSRTALFDEWRRSQGMLEE